jgi:hypothetical protein
MRRFERWSFHFESKQLRDLKELSRRTSVPQSVFVREGLAYILRKYRYILTMDKVNPDMARYLRLDQLRSEAMVRLEIIEKEKGKPKRRRLFWSPTGLTDNVSDVGGVSHIGDGDGIRERYEDVIVDGEHGGERDDSSGVNDVKNKSVGEVG